MNKKIFKSPFLHRRELLVVIICFLLFATVLVFSNKLISFWGDFLTTKETVKIEASIQKELKNISLQREQIIASGELIGALKRNNPVELLAVVQAEAKKRNLDPVVVTDKNGFVIARSHLPTQAGDNIFLTSAYGRIISNDGAKAITVVERGSRTPLVAVSASPILDKDLPIGGIAVGCMLYDSYAKRFQEKYLDHGEQIVFYTPKEGIVGDSFNNKSQTKLINSYFSLGSELGTQNLTGLSKEVKIDNDYYIIQNIIFPGIEESPGGAFILFPVQHKLLSFLLASGVILFFLLFYYLTVFLLKFLPHHKNRLLFVLLLSLLSFVAVYFTTLIKLDYSALVIKKTPYLIYNSTIKFDPESDVISQSVEKTIAIKVSSGGEAINAVSAVVNYDPKAVEVLDISTTNSFCDPSFFLEKEINKEKGEVRISCIIPSPGFHDTVGTVAELLLQPLGIESVSLKFSNETEVLANDGLGTNVLRMATDGYYQVIRQEFINPDIKNPMPIFSSSHPNSNRWYKNKNIKLSWPKLSGGTYYYNFSSNPNQSKEDKILSTTNNFLNTTLGDGIYYFHLQAKDAKGKLGPISNFKIMIDSTPPAPTNIKMSNEILHKGDVLRLEFTSEDTLSGLQSGFYIQINKGVFLPVKPPFYIPFLEIGDYSIVVRVFDKANNFSDSSRIIHVTK